MPLIGVLLNTGFVSSAVPLSDLQYLDPTLNPSQKESVRFALEAVEVACIHGPPGTGKTHTLVEIIRQLVGQGKRVLVCGASNLAVDNLLERLVPHGIPLTRIGHPARVMSNLLSSTLDSQTVRSEQFALARDVKSELDSAMTALTGKTKGRLKGPERKKMWDEVRELRKEYRKREKTAVTSVVTQAKVRRSLSKADLWFERRWRLSLRLATRQAADSLQTRNSMWLSLMKRPRLWNL